MKILLLNQVFYPDSVATAQHSTDLALHLIEQGHEVTVVAGRRAYENRAVIYPAYERYKGIEIHRAHSTGFGKRSFFHRIVDAVTFFAGLGLQLLKVPKHDVVICFTSPPLIGLFGIFFCKLRGGKLVQWMMDINPDSAIAVGYLKKGSPISQMLVNIFRFTVRHTDLIIVLDRWMKKTLISHGAAESSIVIIPPWPVHPIDAHAQRESNANNPFRLELGLVGKFIVLFSGNHSIVHPVATLLEAAKQMRDIDDVRFVFIGHGLRVGEVTAFKEKHRLTNIIQLPFQPREKLATALNLADLQVVLMGNAVSGLVHSSKIYGVLGSGCPFVAIAQEQSHLEDVLKDKAFGYRVDHGEPLKLVETILKAKSLKGEELDRIHSTNIRYVVTQYAAPVILSKVDAALTNLHHGLQEPIEPSEMQENRARAR